MNFIEITLMLNLVLELILHLTYKVSVKNFCSTPNWLTDTYMSTAAQSAMMDQSYMYYFN